MNYYNCKLVYVFTLTLFLAFNNTTVVSAIKEGNVLFSHCGEAVKVVRGFAYEVEGDLVTVSGECKVGTPPDFTVYAPVTKTTLNIQFTDITAVTTETSRTGNAGFIMSNGKCSISYFPVKRVPKHWSYLMPPACECGYMYLQWNRDAYFFFDALSKMPKGACPKPYEYSSFKIGSGTSMITADILPWNFYTNLVIGHNAKWGKQLFGGRKGGIFRFYTEKLVDTITITGACKTIPGKGDVEVFTGTSYRNFSFFNAHVENTTKQCNLYEADYDYSSKFCHATVKNPCLSGKKANLTMKCYVNGAGSCCGDLCTNQTNTRGYLFHDTRQSKYVGPGPKPMFKCYKNSSSLTLEMMKHSLPGLFNFNNFMGKLKSVIEAEINSSDPYGIVRST